MPTVNICYSPILYPVYQNQDAIVVVVDIFRATSSICTAFANGAKTIIPVATIEEALDYQSKGYLVAAERDAEKCDFADFGNSPFEYVSDKVIGKDIVFTTTNGTKTIKMAGQHIELILGSFLNLSAVADFCIQKGKDVLVLCSGWNDTINLEDVLFGGAVAECICRYQNYHPHGDASILAIDCWAQHKGSVIDFLRKGNHVERLLKNNHKKDILYCLQQNIFNFVPQLKSGHFFIESNC